MIIACFKWRVDKCLGRTAAAVSRFSWYSFSGARRGIVVSLFFCSLDFHKLTNSTLACLSAAILLHPLGDEEILLAPTRELHFRPDHHLVTFGTFYGGVDIVQAAWPHARQLFSCNASESKPNWGELHGAGGVAFASHKRNPEISLKIIRVSKFSGSPAHSSVHFVRQKW